MWNQAKNSGWVYYEYFIWTIVLKKLLKDGETEDAPVKFELCGEKSPKAIVSNGDALRISIIVPFDQTFYAINEFEAHYSVLDNCKRIHKFLCDWYIF